MRRGGIFGLLLFLGLVTWAGSAAAATFTVTGRFLDQDRIYDKFGYTGTAQDLPIRRADVEVVKTREHGDRDGITAPTATTAS
jgi:hypothetical protein